MNVIAPAVSCLALNALWTVVAPSGDEEAQTFGVPLSSDGGATVTHYGISTAATVDMVSLAESLSGEFLSLGAVVSVQDHDSNDWFDLLGAAGLVAMEEA